MAFNKKPGVTIAIGVSKKPGEGPPRAPKGMADAPRFPGEEETPDAPEDQDDAGEGIPPEAVCYRTADQKCGACTYFQGGQCSKLKMPVGDSDSCNLFDQAEGEESEGESGMDDDEGMEDQQ